MKAEIKEQQQQLEVSAFVSSRRVIEDSSLATEIRLSHSVNPLIPGKLQ